MDPHSKVDFSISFSFLFRCGTARSSRDAVTVWGWTHNSLRVPRCGQQPSRGQTICVSCNRLLQVWGLGSSSCGGRFVCHVRVYRVYTLLFPTPLLDSPCMMTILESEFTLFDTTPLHQQSDDLAPRAQTACKSCKSWDSPNHHPLPSPPPFRPPTWCLEEESAQGILGDRLQVPSSCPLLLHCSGGQQCSTKIPPPLFFYVCLFVCLYSCPHALQVDRQNGGDGVLPQIWNSLLWSSHQV